MAYEPGNRLYYLTEDDARAWPCVFAWITLIFSSLTMIARGYARRKKWTWSDWCSCKMRCCGERLSAADQGSSD